MSQPIRVFWSELSKRFYASREYRIRKNGVVTIYGDKFDVTDDIAAAVVKHELEFTPVPPSEK